MPELFRAEALQHLFPDGKAGIENVSLSIDEGESVLVAGKNGAGKSLLMRHFTRTFQAYLGSDLLSRPSPLPLRFR
jgi:ABC-type phosphate/phosphonate transport system ATPase subunit